MLCKARWTGARYELLHCFRMESMVDIWGVWRSGRVKIHWIIGFSVQRAAAHDIQQDGRRQRIHYRNARHTFRDCSGAAQKPGRNGERSNVYLISPLKFYSAGILGTPALFTMLVLRSCAFPLFRRTNAKAASLTIIARRWSRYDQDIINCNCL